MRPLKLILIYGFALFAMFFGSGNLVFPIKIGQLTGQYWFLGFLGLFFTGIILPFLGLFVVKLYRGDSNSFFAEAGGFAKLILPLFTLSLLGSFGVVPRCITVAYGGMNYMTPSLSLKVFSPLFCLVTFFFCLKEQRMLSVLGKWLSPILLSALAALIAAGIMTSPSIAPLPSSNLLSAFSNGFLTGYQTMDLFAAFFFSALIFKQLQKMLLAEIGPKEMMKFAIKPSVLGALLLAIVYLGFVFLGASFSSLIANVEPEFMLATIATHIMGKNAAFLIALAMLLSCLTTAVALNNIYANYLWKLLGLKEDKFVFVLFGTTTVSFLISLFDFKGIASFLAPALEISYPSVIALTILCIVTRKFSKLKIVVFYGLLLVIALTYFGRILLDLL